MVEDLEWIAFPKLHLTGREYPYREPGSSRIVGIPIPEYFFGDTGFDINHAENSSDNVAEWLGGTGLDRGHLQLFSKISLIGRELIPHYWHIDEKLRHDLRNPPQHLNTVEEIWWLDRWLALQNIVKEHRLIPGSKVDVDWRFALPSQISVNLEVKRVPSDCVRHARGRVFSAFWFKKFCEEKVLPKFRPSEENEVNVLAISLFGELDREVQTVMSEWLSAQKVIDAIVIATREGRRKSTFDCQLRGEKAQLMKHFLRGPDEEDQSLAFALEVPVKLPGFPV